MPPDATPEIRELHAAYCHASGFALSDLPLTWPRIDAWRCWLMQGLTREDIGTAVSIIRRLMAEGSVDYRSLEFRNLVGQPDTTQERIANYRRMTRARRAPQTSVQHARGEPDPGDPVRSAGEVLGEDPEKVKALFANLKAQVIRTKGAA